MRPITTLAAVGTIAGFCALATPVLAQFVPPRGVPNPSNLGNRCATAAGICTLSRPGPLGTACTCRAGQNVVSGQIIR